MIAFDPFDLKGQADRENDRRHFNAVEQTDEEKDWAWLLSTPRGRKMVADVLGWTGVFRTSFSTNGSEMSFREGQRNVGLRLLATIQRCAPESVAELIKENTNG